MQTFVVALALGAIVASPAPRQVIVTSEHFASSHRTCAVLQAAYSQASHARELIYPPDVRSGARVLTLSKIVPEYQTKLPLSAREFDDLRTQESVSDFPRFKPHCRWSGKMGPTMDGEGHKTHVTFTSPIFSRSGRIAMVEVSFLEEGWFGFGEICVVRRSRSGWKAKCESSWIT